MAEKNKGGAKGKYAEWITDEGLLKVEGWVESEYDFRIHYKR